MTHEQWHARMRSSLARAERHPARALKSLDALASRVAAEAARHVGDWHVEQTAEAISIVQSHAGRHRESADGMLQLAQRHGQQVAYYRRAFVTACAAAALELASAGDRPGATSALRRAAPEAAALAPKEKLFRKAQRVVAAMRRSAGGGRGTRRAPRPSQS